MDESNNRADLLNENDIAKRVKDMRSVMDKFKQTQFIGSDSIRFYKTDTGDPYDWSGSMPASPQASNASNKILRVTATAKKQNVLFADLIAELRVDSNSNPRYTVIDYAEDLQNSVNFFDIRHYPDPIPPTQTNKVSWTVVAGGTNPNGLPRPTETVFMKHYIVANDDVDIEIEELN